MSYAPRARSQFYRLVISGQGITVPGNPADASFHRHQKRKLITLAEDMIGGRLGYHGTPT
ncbi:MAG: hypothetical protein NTV68_02135 [Methanomicrobiales archaeon]|nr:hypothetical protein [Methanomicrobiales archaeon]